MRKIIFGLLLAGAAAPAFAAGGPGIQIRDDDNTPRHQAHADRPARSGGDQGQRPQNFQRPQVMGNHGRPEFQRPQFSGEGQHGRPAFDGNGFAQQSPDSVRNWRPRDQRSQQGAYWQQQQVRQQDVNRYNRDEGQRYQGAYGNRDRNMWRQGAQSPFRAEGNHSIRVQWNRDWRNDRRYDWRERRNHNRSIFHLGLYIDPFGWGYQPYSIGYDLQPGYYQQNYWIDPAMYGLPYPPPGTQWVRYWNDALLVDMYTGQIVDSIQGFFW